MEMCMKFKINLFEVVLDDKYKNLCFRFQFQLDKIVFQLAGLSLFSPADFGICGTYKRSLFLLKFTDY